MLLFVTVITPFVLEILFKVSATDAECSFFFIFLKQKFRWSAWNICYWAGSFSYTFLLTLGFTLSHHITGSQATVVRIPIPILIRLNRSISRNTFIFCLLRNSIFINPKKNNVLKFIIVLEIFIRWELLHFPIYLISSQVEV